MILCTQHWDASLCWASKEKSHLFKIFSVLGLCGKLSVARMAIGVVSVRRYWKLPLCQVEAMPVGCKMDPVLAKAESISNSECLEGNVFKRKGKNGSAGTIAAEEKTKNV